MSTYSLWELCSQTPTGALPQYHAGGLHSIPRPPRPLHTHIYSILTTIFQAEPWVCQFPLILLFLLFLNCAAFRERSKFSMSSLTQSHQVFHERPLCLIPSTSHVIQRLTQSLFSSCSTRTNRLSLLFLIIKFTGFNPKSSLSMRKAGVDE